MNQHGILLAVTSVLTSLSAWFLAHIQVIDSLMQFYVLLAAAIVGTIGVRKVFKREDE